MEEMWQAGRHHLAYKQPVGSPSSPGSQQGRHLEVLCGLQTPKCCHLQRLLSAAAPLTWLLNFKEPEGQLARWMEILQGYDFDI